MHKYTKYLNYSICCKIQWTKQDFYFKDSIKLISFIKVPIIRKNLHSVKYIFVDI